MAPHIKRSYGFGEQSKDFYLAQKAGCEPLIKKKILLSLQGSNLFNIAYLSGKNIGKYPKKALIWLNKKLLYAQQIYQIIWH